MKILFITRKYPPITGGMEKYSKELYSALSAVTSVDLFANKKGNRFLPFFLVAAAIRIIVTAKRYDVIHLGDGLLGVLVPLAHACGGSAVTITVHGLDVTYDRWLYRAVIIPRILQADRVVAISRNTRALCLARGIPAERIAVIPNGISFESGDGLTATRPRNASPALDSGRILCTVGRLIKRKGHEWFVREVMPRLDGSYVYLIAGDGPERSAIERAIADLRLENRVLLLGLIGDGEKEWLLRAAHLFIMPNIPVAGDVEGFGLVLAEAATRGLMSIASDLDGIPDAVLPGQSGILVEPLNSGAFAAAIESAEPDRDRVAAAADSFAWPRIAGLYVEELQKALEFVSNDKVGSHGL